MENLLGRRLRNLVRVGARAIRRDVGVVAVALATNGWAANGVACVEKSMTEVYGTYVYAEKVWWNIGVAPPDIDPKARAFIGREISIGPDRFTMGNKMIVDPYYEVSCYPAFVEGEVPVDRYSNFYGIGMGRGVIDALRVYHPDDTGRRSPHIFEIVGDDLWKLTGDWLFVIKPTTRE